MPPKKRKVTVTETKTTCSLLYDECNNIKAGTFILPKKMKKEEKKNIYSEKYSYIKTFYEDFIKPCNDIEQLGLSQLKKIKEVLINIITSLNIIIKELEDEEEENEEDEEDEDEETEKINKHMADLYEMYRIINELSILIEEKIILIKQANSAATQLAETRRDQQHKKVELQESLIYINTLYHNNLVIRKKILNTFSFNEKEIYQEIEKELDDELLQNLKKHYKILTGHSYEKIKGYLDLNHEKIRDDLIPFEFGSEVEPTSEQKEQLKQTDPSEKYAHFFKQKLSSAPSPRAAPSPRGVGELSSQNSSQSSPASSPRQDQRKKEITLINITSLIQELNDILYSLSYKNEYKTYLDNCYKEVSKASASSSSSPAKQDYNDLITIHLTDDDSPLHFQFFLTQILINAIDFVHDSNSTKGIDLLIEYFTHYYSHPPKQTIINELTKLKTCICAACSGCINAEKAHEYTTKLFDNLLKNIKTQTDITYIPNPYHSTSLIKKDDIEETDDVFVADKIGAPPKKAKKGGAKPGKCNYLESGRYPKELEDDKCDPPAAAVLDAGPSKPSVKKLSRDDAIANPITLYGDISSSIIWIEYGFGYVETTINDMTIKFQFSLTTGITLNQVLICLEEYAQLRNGDKKTSLTIVQITIPGVKRDIPVANQQKPLKEILETINTNNKYLTIGGIIVTICKTLGDQIAILMKNSIKRLYTIDTFLWPTFFLLYYSGQLKKLFSIYHSNKYGWNKMEGIGDDNTSELIALFEFICCVLFLVGSINKNDFLSAIFHNLNEDLVKEITRNCSLYRGGLMTKFNEEILKINNTHDMNEFLFLLHLDNSLKKSKQKQEEVITQINASTDLSTSFNQYKLLPLLPDIEEFEIFDTNYNHNRDDFNRMTNIIFYFEEGMLFCIVVKGQSVTALNNPGVVNRTGTNVLVEVEGIKFTFDEDNTSNILLPDAIFIIEQFFIKLISSGLQSQSGQISKVDITILLKNMYKLISETYKLFKSPQMLLKTFYDLMMNYFFDKHGPHIKTELKQYLTSEVVLSLQSNHLIEIAAELKKPFQFEHAKNMLIGNTGTINPKFESLVDHYKKNNPFDLTLLDNGSSSSSGGGPKVDYRPATIFKKLPKSQCDITAACSSSSVGSSSSSVSSSSFSGKPVVSSFYNFGSSKFDTDFGAAAWNPEPIQITTDLCRNIDNFFSGEFYKTVQQTEIRCGGSSSDEKILFPIYLNEATLKNPLEKEFYGLLMRYKFKCDIIQPFKSPLEIQNLPPVIYKWLDKHIQLYNKCIKQNTPSASSGAIALSADTDMTDLSSHAAADDSGAFNFFNKSSSDAAYSSHADDVDMTGESKAQTTFIINGKTYHIGQEIMYDDNNIMTIIGFDPTNNLIGLNSEEEGQLWVDNDRFNAKGLKSNKTKNRRKLISFKRRKLIKSIAKNKKQNKYTITKRRKQNKYTITKRRKQNKYTFKRRKLIKSIAKKTK